jgi:hypothetical protein
VRRPAPTHCPVCQAGLRIARLECDDCKTAIEGDFDGGRLGRLSREQLGFVEVFMDCRGKIKDVEQRLGLSYPTVVSRLEQVVQAMGDVPRPATREDRIDDLLDAVARGQVSAVDAAARLRGRRGRKSDE